jgi:Ca2+/H+ antiporter, TMEM165/GDT1 family
MNALVPAFIVAALIELGSRSQLLAMLLGDRFRRPGPVLAGILIAALVNMALAATAGFAITLYIEHTAILLMTGVALLLAGGGAVFAVKPPEPIDGWKLGAFASSCGSFLILALANETQFVTATIAAATGQPILAAIGATAGIMAADTPAVILGRRWSSVAPLRAIRIVAGMLLALAGVVLAIRALGLA